MKDIKSKSIRILGIDPGSRTTGYGVIEKRKNSLSYVACGVIKTNSKMALPERLGEIHEGLCSVIESYKPTHAAVEEVFVSINPKSALKLGHARGVAILAAIQAGMEISEFSPRVIKQAVVGYGHAKKEQIQAMVRILLNLEGTPSSDAADALAVAICSANYNDSMKSR